jgi:phenylalanyl-tRNA synthetase beta chain
MKILTHWLRSYLPVLDVDDAQLAEDLTLRGIAVEGVFELNDLAGDSDAALFDMDITTNRVDAMNHYGIAREVAAIYDVPLHKLDIALPAPGPAEQPFPVKIEAPERCGRFTAQVIRGVTVKPSDGILSHYFSELGQKQISNAVDATNFVLLGMGHPTHAFDLDKIEGGIVVRMAFAGEQLRLLDGSTRTLVADDLVVADEKKALALAGVMGGWDSMITAATKNVLVEAAWFEPAGIRASSRRHLLHTDASHRFERGADFAAAPVANHLVAKQILAACGGALVGEMVDVVIPEHEAVTVGRAAIELSVARVQKLLGKTIDPGGITAALVARYLMALGCKLRALSEDLYEVMLPSWRLDLTREIDLIEEVARVYGYNGFANTLPTPGIVLAHPSSEPEKRLRQRLLAIGYSEAISSTFASAADCAAFAPGAVPVPLENPLNEEAANLRPTLLPGMVAMLAHNLNRDVPRARLFETGGVFRGGTGEVQETLSLALGLTGTLAATAIHSANDAPFFELKGVIESVLGLFATPLPVFKSLTGNPAFEAGRAASVKLGNAVIASFGQLATGESAQRKLRQPVYLAELNLEALFRLPLKHVTARELSRFQAAERDFSFTIAETTPWGQIDAAIRALDIAELQKLALVEVFRDAVKLPGQMSILIRTVFQSDTRTLEDADLSAWSAAIIAAVEGLGGKLRG